MRREGGRNGGRGTKKAEGRFRGGRIGTSDEAVRWNEGWRYNYYESDKCGG
jgi:hypothetical protein